MRWTRKGIVAEIQHLHRAGIALNYASAETHHSQLMRAAAWHFGTWRHAVETAGIDYNALSRYHRWGRERVVEHIRELHQEGADLSWRSVSLEVDPALAAAALRPNGFASWRHAIAAAGLDIEEVARYQAWDAERVLREIRALHQAKKPMSSRLVQISNQALFCAARRRFGSWDEALSAAGLDVAQIRLRGPAQRHQVNGHRNNHRRAASATPVRAASPSPSPSRTIKPLAAKLSRTAATSSTRRAKPSRVKRS